MSSGLSQTRIMEEDEEEEEDGGHREVHNTFLFPIIYLTSVKVTECTRNFRILEYANVLLNTGTDVFYEKQNTGMSLSKV